MIILKTNNQIKIMREACQIVKETLDLMEKSVRVGITTKRIRQVSRRFY